VPRKRPVYAQIGSPRRLDSLRYLSISLLESGPSDNRDQLWRTLHL